MKIKKVEAICKSDRRISILNDPVTGAQWLGNGTAMYLLDGMPTLDASTIFTLFDIAEKDHEKYILREDLLPDRYNFSDSDDYEYILDRSSLSVTFNGYTGIPFKSDIGAIYIESRYLAPLDKTPKGYELYLRYTEDRHPYVAVKSGLFIIAVILPCIVFIQKDFVEALIELSAHSQLAYNYFLDLGEEYTPEESQNDRSGITKG